MNESLKQVVMLLADGGFHSGTEIGQVLGVSRAAVFKTVEKLREVGVDVTSVTGKGYCLVQPLSLLSETRIASGISEKLYSRIERIIVLDEIASTNDYLLPFATEPNKQVQLCVAEMQTAGRGRRGRSWFSPFGENVYYSMLWPLKKELGQLQGLSLVVALAVVHALEKVGVSGLSVKWPNDVWYQRQKISGVLLSVQADANDMGAVIIGIGINANMVEADAIDQSWTSVMKVLNRLCDRNLLIAELTNALFDYLDKFEQTDFSSFLPEWNHLDALHGKAITVHQPQGDLHGTAVGVESNGELQLEAAAEKISISVGDVSVRIKT